VLRSLLLSFAALPTAIALADEALVAVAASFLPPMEALAVEFERDTDHEISIASGSTGALFAQISNGAPFDLFVAADSERPRRLAEAGIGLEPTRATIALGRLVLYGARAPLIRAAGIDALRAPGIRRIAIANPSVAPYGIAARQALEALGLWTALESKLVRGQSVAQAFAMTATGNAELGLVALSQVLSRRDETGAYVAIPETLYEPIRQDLIVLTRAQHNAAALSLREYLLGERGRTTIASFGYAFDAH